MSSGKLDTLIDEFPEEREAIDRLAALLRPVDKGPEVRELTIQRLFDVLRPSSDRVLAKLLIKAAQCGLMERVVRVESDARGGTQDFSSIEEIPDVLFDTRKGYEIEVRPDQIRMIYKIRRQSEAK